MYTHTQTRWKNADNVRVASIAFINIVYSSPSGIFIPGELKTVSGT